MTEEQKRPDRCEIMWTKGFGEGLGTIHRVASDCIVAVCDEALNAHELREEDARKGEEIMMLTSVVRECLNFMEHQNTIPINEDEQHFRDKFRRALEFVRR